MFAEMQLAERDEPEYNILQPCPLSKYLDSEAFCKAIVPRGRSYIRSRRAERENRETPPAV